MKEILRIEIPNYITHVKLCNSRLQKFYTPNSRIPIRYRNEKYKFNPYGILAEKTTGKLVLANPKTADTPLLRRIEGKLFLQGKVNAITRSKIVREMEAFYKSYLPNYRNPVRISKIMMEIHNTVDEGSRDIEDMGWIMVKVINDTLAESGILPSSSNPTVKGYEVKLVPINSSQKRKVVITLLNESERSVKS